MSEFKERLERLMHKTPLDKEINDLREVVNAEPPEIIATFSFGRSPAGSIGNTEIQAALNAAVKPFNEKRTLEYYDRVYKAAKRFVEVYETDTES